jgi:DNA-binding GntR family transcriptional regulator
MLKQLNNRVTVLRRISMAQPGRLPRTLREIGAIVDAIEARDADAAARLCEEHVRHAAESVMQSMHA